MRFVSIGYTHTASYNDPEQWLDRISFHTGILEELAKRHEVESIEQIDYSGNMVRKGVLYHFPDLPNAGSHFPIRLHSYIKRRQPDVVLVNGFIFPLQIIQLRLVLGNRVRILVINHAEKPSGGIRKILQQLANRCVHRYLFTSKETGAAWVRAGIISNENKIAEVMEASSVFSVMDKEEARAKTGISSGLVFLWVGRLDGNKDPLTVLNAFSAFIKQQPSAKLYMIFHTEELKPAVIRLCENDPGLQKAVTLVGKIPHQEMPYWYNSADFIISGSHYEGSGIAVCEAMSCGCVPILTNIPSFRKMTGRGACGFLYEAGDAEALLRTLLLTTELDMDKEKDKVLQQFKEDLSFEAIAKQIEQAVAAI